MPPDRWQTQVIVPLTQPDPADMRRAMTAAAQAGADAVELRLDYLLDTSDAALALLLTDPPCPVLLTCRAAAEGGKSAAADRRRAALLARAVKLGGRWVDFERAAMGHAGELIEALAADRGDLGRCELIVSAHDFAGRPDDLPAQLAEMEAAGGDVNKFAFAAAGPEDAWAAFDLLRAAAKPTIALAMGAAGVPSRILAGKFGAFGTFAALAPGAGSAPGQPTLAELKRLYRWDAITPQTKVFGVIGCPVGHSMSPAIHNAAFAADGLDAVYVPLRIEPGADNFNRFIDAALERPWTHLAGLSVTIPHKENALARVGPGNVDALARAIGAVNTIVFTGNSAAPLRGINTDYAAAIDALVTAMGCEREALAGRRVAVLGAGGAARAIVAALAHYRADTTVYNRTVRRAECLADEFNARDGGGTVAAAGRDELAQAEAEIFINCTPIGMHPNTDASPLPAELALPANAVVFDTIYNPAETLLLRRATAAGCTTVSGIDMFLNQAVAQYQAWTHRTAPRQIMCNIVLEKLAGR